MPEPATIMVVDDDEISLRLIASSLQNAGYRLRPIKDSRQVPAALKDGLPDLFLLDVLMPELDGIQLCKLLKDRSDTRDIPVIFLTAAEETDQKIDAFKAGAEDYITKPVNAVELNLRIKTHLELFFARRKLQDYASDMENLARQRADQLIHADRLALLGALSAGVAHEINNPTTFISGNVQTLERFWEILGREVSGLKQPSSATKDQLDFIALEMPELLKGIKDGVIRIKQIVQSLTFFARKEEGKREVFYFKDSLNKALELCNKILKDNVRLDLDIDEGIRLLGDNQQIEQVLVNLIVNAVDAMEKTANPFIAIKAKAGSGKVMVSLADNGPGIDQALADRIWEPFFTTKDSGKGTGLGLSIVRSIIEAHGGRVCAFNVGEGGFRVEISLPAPTGQS